MACGQKKKITDVVERIEKLEREKGVIRVDAKYFDQLVKDRHDFQKRLEQLEKDRIELADRVRRNEATFEGIGIRIAVSTDAREKAWPPGRRIENRCPVKTPDARPRG